MKNRITIFTLLLSFSLFFTNSSPITSEPHVLPVREVELDKSEVDYESYLNSFDDAKVEKEGSVISFEGKKSLDAFDLSKVDLVSLETDEEQLSKEILFKVTYDKDISKAVIEASFADGDEKIVDSLPCLVFENEKGDVDAIISLDDGSSILLSDLSDKVDNCGLLSRWIKRIIYGAGELVISVVCPYLLPTIVMLNKCDPIGIVEKTKALNNYTHNKNNKEPVDYINNQPGCNDWWYGFNTLNNNGCGVIAAYNVLHGLHMHRDLKNIILDFEYNGGSLAFGFFGSDPSHFREYFKEQHLTVVPYFSYDTLEKGIRAMSSKQRALLCAWNGANIREGAHFVAIEYAPWDPIEKQIHAFNSYQKFDRYSEYSNIKSIMGGGYIAGLIVG